MKDETYNFFGFLPPVEGDVGFVTLVFSLREKLYIQISEKGRITDFAEISQNVAKEAEQQDKSSFQVNEGDETLFGYKFPIGDVIFGPREKLQKKISNRLEEIRTNPFDFLNVSAFLNQKRFKKEAVERSYAFLAREDRESAIRWGRFIESRLDVPRASKIYELNTIALYDFCTVLIKFAKVYEKYLRNRDKKYMAKYQYESLFHRLTTFIFDEDFVHLLEGEIEELKLAPAQLAFDFPDTGENRVRHLSRLGISKSKINSFYRSVEKINNPDSIDEVSFASILNLDKLMIDEAQLSRGLNKVEKKIRKRELSTGLISIIYGTLLVLGGMDVWYSRDRKRGDVMKSEGVRAITCGLQNLAPENVRNIDLSKENFL